MNESRERQALSDIVALIESHRPYWSDEVTDEIEVMAKEALEGTAPPPPPASNSPHTPAGGA
jgi:hypothetical protein